MSAGDSESIRAAAREALRELLPDMLRDALAPAEGASGNGNGHQAVAAEPEPVPLVPAPPVAAVLRPSTWAAPAAPGEIVGDKPPYTGKISHDASADGRAESVSIDNDEDLNSFVRSLAKRLDSPRERHAIRTGQVRFALRPTAPVPRSSGGAPALRIEKGAVTERIVRRAADEGARLVLGRGAVLTPLARDQAKALGVEIEKERTC
ncbi:MAG TPA: hypothetical protein VKT31_05365 [Solirubrobacteraceae bacterium]|nr:hypothetical protein [Solirubrobacteraceae bacterium]